MRKMKQKSSEELVLYPKLRDFMRQAWEEFSQSHPGTIFESDFAMACGVSATNMGRYIKGTQMPGQTAQAGIARVAGIGIYDACEVPPALPDDPDVVKMVQLWPKLTQDQRHEILKKMEETAKANKTARYKIHVNQQPLEE